MADFMKAIDWLILGKKVKRECMMKPWIYHMIGGYVYFDDDEDCRKEKDFSIRDFKATDWEIHKEEK